MVELSEDVAFREMNGESVLLDLASGTYFGLNEVGTRLWTLLGQDSSLERAAATLRNEYDVAPEKLEADVLRMLTELQGKGLLRISSGTSAYGTTDANPSLSEGQAK